MSNVLQFPSRQLKMENPTDVTFIGMQATWNSKPVALTFQETVDYSQVHLLIERFREMGGVFVGQRPFERWFLPWPCIVHVSPSKAVQDHPPYCSQ